MNTVDHPTPPDWLDRLDRGLSASDETHLAACPACRQIVRRLQEHADVAAPGGRAATGMAVPLRPSREPPEANEIWQLRGEPDLVVVLAGPVADLSEAWWSVLAADAEVAALTDAEVALEAGETSLGYPLRLRLAYQAALPLDRFAARLGTLTESGRAVLDAALMRDVSPDRRGAPLASATDWRGDVDADAWRRWWRLQAVQQQALHASEDAAAEVRRLLREAPPDAAPALLGERLRRAMAAVDDLHDLWPSAERWRAVQAALAAHPPPEQAELGPWPITPQTHEHLEVRLERTPAGVEVWFTGIPDELEGTIPLVALPGAYRSGARAAWSDGVRGLVAVEETVSEGTAAVVLYDVPEDTAHHVMVGASLLPPGLAGTASEEDGSDDGRTHRVRLALADGVAVDVDALHAERTPVVRADGDSELARRAAFVLARDDRAAAAAVHLAVAESRRRSHPAGPWAIDAALAGVHLARSLDVGPAAGADEVLAETLRARAHEALDWLDNMPRLIAELGGSKLREDLFGGVEELEDFFGEESEVGERVQAWRHGFRARERPRAGRPRHERKEIPMQSALTVLAPWLDVAESGLVLPSTFVVFDDEQPGVRRAALDIRPAVAIAYGNALDAWRAALQRDVSVNEFLRAALLLEAAVRLPRDEPSAVDRARSLRRHLEDPAQPPGVAPRLPAPWLYAFDPETGMIRDRVRLDVLERDAESAALTAVLPQGFEKRDCFFSLKARDLIDVDHLVGEVLASATLDPQGAGVRALRVARRSSSTWFEARLLAAAAAALAMAPADPRHAALETRRQEAAVRLNQLGLEEPVVLADAWDSLGASLVRWSRDARRHAASVLESQLSPRGLRGRTTEQQEALVAELASDEIRRLDDILP